MTDVTRNTFARRGDVMDMICVIEGIGNGMMSGRES